MDAAAPSQPQRERPPGPAPAAPTREEIALRAWELYCARGDRPGSADEDWCQAEAELRLKVTLRPRR